MKKKTVRKLRKKLSKPGLLEAARDCFEKIEDTLSGRSFTLADYLMSGLAVFSLKHSFLLEFDKAVHTEQTVRSNLENLFGISRAPSDSGLQKRLDELDPGTIRGTFKSLFSELQRSYSQIWCTRARSSP